MHCRLTSTAACARPNVQDAERSLLEAACEQARTSLSDFVRRKAPDAAEIDLLERPLVTIPAADWEAFVGYVTLSAGQIERAALPKLLQRNKPDPVPATLLGQLAIDKAHQGRGYAHSLLLFALRAALRASYDVGSFGVFTHPLDEAARGFYARWGFQDLPFDPRRGMIVSMIDLESNGWRR